MNATWGEWLNLAVRWFHVFAGILWIGQTYYFTWLDGRMAEEEEAGNNSDASPPRVWMVHSGGFYVVEKQRIPKLLPMKLHRFRWESALTWLSGMVLLVMVYYLGGAMVDTSVADITNERAILMGVATLVFGWLVYDLLWSGPLEKHPAAGAVISYLLLVGLAYELSRYLSGRAMYIHVGALMGTIMAANVWMRIIPAQRALVAAAREGRMPEMRLATRAKLRTRHNTYMVIPVVLLMISNHYPVSTYGDRYGWAILAVLVLVGGIAAHIVRRA